MDMFLGIDVSTQSITSSVIAIGIDDGIEKGKIIFEHSLPYTKLNNLLAYGIDQETMILPYKKNGESMQPPLMFLEALDLMLEEVSTHVSCANIKAISISAQQHGHVYLGDRARACFEELEKSSSGLVEVFKQENVFAFPHAPIWMMSASEKAADEIRDALGGSDAIEKLSGSNSPARFTGAVMKYIAREYPDEYKKTKRVHLLSSFFSGILSANYDASIDWGNASGMTLMNYHNKTWSEELAQAVSEVGDAQEVLSKLPPLSQATHIVGSIAEYFVDKYGFSKDCVICAGSGDNPQSKVPISGDLLSLGSSFVIMASNSASAKRIEGAHAMYDGKNEAFVFACRTNGALVWDKVRSNLNMDFIQCESCLEKHHIGASDMVWQPLQESFPLSRDFEMQDVDNSTKDYVGIIDSTLALVHYYSKEMMSDDTQSPLFVTGGPSNSKGIITRVAAFWDRPVIKIRSAGASFGAAISAYLGQQINIKKRNENELKVNLFANIVPDLLDAQDPVIASYEDVQQSTIYEQKIVKKLLLIMDKFK